MIESSREPFRSTLRTDADVTAMWRTMISPLGWRTRRIYLVFVDPAGRVHPQVVEIDETPPALTAEDADRFLDFLGHLLGGPDADEPSSAAIMFARPGTAALTDGDRSLCRELYAAASRTGVRLELLHVATDTAIVPAPMDEVLPRSA